MWWTGQNSKILASANAAKVQLRAVPHRIADGLRQHILAVLTMLIVPVVGAAMQSERVKEQFPALVAAQLRFHHWVHGLNPHQPKVKLVTVVEVDDEAYWRPPFSGTTPTNRASLGDLVWRAADAGAIVIGLDFRLSSPFASPGDDASRSEGNAHLLAAARATVEKGVPLVLAAYLVPDQHGGRKSQPIIYRAEEVPSLVRFGHINLPRDKRQIPLKMVAWEWDKSAEKEFDSFGFKVASAYEEATHRNPRLQDDASIRDAMDANEFVYGGFVDVAQFLRVSARKLLDGDRASQALCKNRVVIIGGTWHRDAEDIGPQVEEYTSPIGTIPGVYFHANYAEALLDDRFARPIPEWAGLLVDFLLAGLLLYGVHRFRGAVGALPVVGVFVLVTVAGYVLLANFGRYFDCVIALSVCLVHLGLEHYMDLVNKAGKLTTGAVSAGNPINAGTDNKTPEIKNSDASPAGG
jgi:CHASE2 domain-containing sensor protein